MNGETDLIFLATTNAPQSRIHVDKHLIGYATMQFMARGGVQLSYDDRVYRLEGAWFWPAHPGPRIRFHVADGHPFWHHRHVGFQGPLVGRWIAAGLWPDAPQPAPESQDWEERFDTLIGLAQRTDRWGRLRGINLLEQLLLELAEARAAPTSDETWLEQALARLDNTAAFSPDYIALASVLGLGLSTLRRRFREATGMSLHDYVLQARMASALRLLSETDLPIKAVADRLGYDNVYFFARQFRQRVGVPPGLYRKSRQR